MSGEQADVERAWAAYGIGREEGTGAHEPGETAGDVSHTDALFLVDAEGRERELVRRDVTVRALAADLRALLEAAT